MSFFDRMERRFQWLAFPGFLRYYALFQVMVFVLQLFRPDLTELLAFDRDKIFAGEIWRVVTMFFSNGQFGRPGIWTIMLLFFAISMVFMVSDGLESAWGTFKTTLFYYTGILLALVANFAYPMAIPFSGMTLYAASFLAFATLFPTVEILLFLILPVQVRLLGILLGLGLVLTILKFPILLPFFLLTFANYFIWAGIPALRGTARVLDAAKRRKNFNAAKLPASDAFHTCIICKKTDVSDPHMEFRIGTDGEEYCDEHLPQ
ncbi:MAG: hypothetical protein V4689_08495 [Verrucomicrobiota bacterium]